LAAWRPSWNSLSPGAGAKAVFESPKVAAHGDFACTAAMQLAKPLKLNPRQLAEQLQRRCWWLRRYQRWVEAIDIAGPGFINIRLKPAAKQQVVREVLARAPFRCSRPTASADGGVRVGQPDRPAACGPWPPGGAGRRDLQPVRHPGLGRAPRVLLQRRRRADRHAGQQHPAARPGLQAGRRRPGPRPPTTATTSRTSPPTSWRKRPCMPTTANSPPAAM
jgi:hypothetical protein